MNTLDKILPAYSTTNNARKIVLEAIERFSKCPCGYHQDECESYGLVGDWAVQDWGNELTGREELQETN